jgi:A/G-specific adenine glycosylase
VETLALRRALLDFYRARARDLPWRRTRAPYAIWVSEIMLQQTQVDTVVPRFASFLRQFPDVAALAAAEETTVCEAWAGLGYYRRARNLHKAARTIVEEHAGRLPTTESAWRALPGIGAYTAAAIAAIAFDQPCAAVDGNLIRVLARVHALPGRASDPALVRQVRALAQALVQGGHAGDVNQALMDLGATVCRPEQPACEVCPLRRYCQGARAGQPTRYPGKKAKPPRQALHIAFAWIARDGQVLLEQRPLDGLWPGLWELPSASGPEATADLSRRLGVPLGARLAEVTHALTHRQVTATVFRAEARAGRLRPCPGSAQRFWDDPLTAPLSSLARKAIRSVSRDAEPAAPPPTGAKAARARRARTSRRTPA